ncbi:MAG TPA: DUF2461 domain-containing protein [Acidimicrobiales bacterium]|nr:DUF2461 domain-containing protein [Acidimicrobiales bacterium]
MSFKGWPPEAIEFYEGLEADNSKSYWMAHRTVYEAQVKGPMEELLAELAPEFGEGKVFRPNRDVRFSADKSPYKTAVAAMAGDLGYVQLSAKGLGVGSGMWMMAADQLERYRRGVDDDGSGEELVAIVAEARTHKLDITGHDTLKTAPRGYPKDHPRIELLRNKGLIAWKEWPPGAWLGTRKAKDRIVDFLHAAQPLNRWLEARVGPSELPEDRRR